VPRREERSEEDGPTCIGLLLILVGLIVAELLWIVFFTYIAVLLRGGS
jgi:hypothetical protein